MGMSRCRFLYCKRAVYVGRLQGPRDSSLVSFGRDWKASVWREVVGSSWVSSPRDRVRPCIPELVSVYAAVVGLQLPAVEEVVAPYVA